MVTLALESAEVPELGENVSSFSVVAAGLLASPEDDSAPFVVDVVVEVEAGGAADGGG